MPSPEKTVLPAYLEPFRDEIEAECGGCSYEELVNDTKTNGFNNAIKSGLICMVDTKARVLARLARRGLLIHPATGEPIQVTEADHA